MVISINATWYEKWNDYGCVTELYDIPDEYSGDEQRILKLFNRIASDFAKQTNDKYAIEQIEYGFDWGIFFDCVDNGFLLRYGVRRLDNKAAMSIDVMHDECFELEGDE